MNALERFNIDIFKLKNDTHNYQFEIGNSFFEAFENSPVSKGQGNVHVKMEKTETFIKLDFIIDVTVELECDRTLEMFDHPIHTEKALLLKFGDTEEEIDENIVIIPREKQRINLAQYI